MLGVGLIRVVIEYKGRVALMRFIDNVKLPGGQVISKAGMCVCRYVWDTSIRWGGWGLSV